MEEICHVFLGHAPNRLAIISHDKRGKTLARDYKKSDEEAAYATGAAALVPFGALRRSVLKWKIRCSDRKALSRQPGSH